MQRNDLNYPLSLVLSRRERKGRRMRRPYRMTFDFFVWLGMLLPFMPSLETTLDPALEWLEPKLFWHHFNLIRQIPRASGKEAAVREHTLEWAKARGFSFKVDAVGNTYIFFPATKGFETAPTVCLQSHYDMVCVKEAGSSHNFDTDPIRLQREGNWVKARETSLGADNGVGGSAAMALADDPEAIHGPIEWVCTIEEETTFKGADGFDPQGQGMRSTYFISLDGGGAEPFIWVGSGGTQSVKGYLSLVREGADEKWEEERHVEIAISGLPGGHSGERIHEPRGNAILFLHELLTFLPSGIRLVSLEGGQATNTIPSEAKAVVCVPGELLHRPWLGGVMERLRTLKEQESTREVVLSLRWCPPEEVVCTAMRRKYQEQISALLRGIPNGVLQAQEEVVPPVGISSNLGIVRTMPTLFEAQLLVRGMLKGDIEETSAKIAALLDEKGIWAEKSEYSAPWEGNSDSPLLRLCQGTYEEVTQERIRAAKMHACLECGVLVNKFPGTIDAVSFGPGVIGEHTPQEAINTDSVPLFYAHLKRTLEKLAKI